MFDLLLLIKSKSKFDDYKLRAQFYFYAFFESHHTAPHHQQLFIIRGKIKKLRNFDYAYAKKKLKQVIVM